MLVLLRPSTRRWKGFASVPGVVRSGQTRMIQIRWAWPRRRDDTHKSMIIALLHHVARALVESSFSEVRRGVGRMSDRPTDRPTGPADRPPDRPTDRPTARPTDLPLAPCGRGHRTRRSATAMRSSPGPTTSSRSRSRGLRTTAGGDSCGPRGGRSCAPLGLRDGSHDAGVAFLCADDLPDIHSPTHVPQTY